MIAIKKCYTAVVFDSVVFFSFLFTFESEYFSSHSVSISLLISYDIEITQTKSRDHNRNFQQDFFPHFSFIKMTYCQWNTGIDMWAFSYILAYVNKWYFFCCCCYCYFGHQMVSLSFYGLKRFFIHFIVDKKGKNSAMNNFSPIRIRF